MEEEEGDNLESVCETVNVGHHVVVAIVRVFFCLLKLEEGGRERQCGRQSGDEPKVGKSKFDPDSQQRSDRPNTGLVRY